MAHVVREREGEEGIEPVGRSGPFAIVALLAIAAGAGLGAAQRGPSPQPSLTVAVRNDRALIEVHVAGWVDAPGVVRLSEGSITADAIEAAGGLRPGAPSHVVNLAAPVNDGDQIFVPGPDAGGVPGREGLVSLNQATASELEALPGVGPVLAERIVTYRDRNGPFGEVEDLLDVPGIGESKLSSIRDLIRVP